MQPFRGSVITKYRHNTNLKSATTPIHKIWQIRQSAHRTTWHGQAWIHKKVANTKAHSVCSSTSNQSHAQDRPTDYCKTIGHFDNAIQATADSCDNLPRWPHLKHTNTTILQWHRNAVAIASFIFLWFYKLLQWNTLMWRQARLRYPYPDVYSATTQSSLQAHKQRKKFRKQHIAHININRRESAKSAACGCANTGSDGQSNDSNLTRPW